MKQLRSSPNFEQLMRGPEDEPEIATERSSLEVSSLQPAPT
jgi:hypothetical protein